MGDLHDRLTKAEPLYAMLPAIFRRCVGFGNLRFNVDTPFCAGDRCYATDDRILVWIAAHEAILKAWSDIPIDTKRKTVTREHIDGVIAGEFAAEPTPIPDLSALPGCRICKGDGRGWCKRCNQPCPCSQCDGSGIKDNQPVPLSPKVSIAAVFAKLLVDNSATVYLPESETTAIKFTLPDGTEGRLMPLAR